MISSKLSDRFVARASPRGRGLRRRRRPRTREVDPGPRPSRRSSPGWRSSARRWRSTRCSSSSSPARAYGAVCGTCSDGWTAFCCTINSGRNSCPPGSFVAGLVEGRQRRVLLRRGPLHHRLQRDLPHAVRLPVLGRRAATAGGSAATSSATASATRRSPATARSCAASPPAPRRGSTTRRARARARPTTPPAATAHPASPTTASPTSSASTGRWAAPTARSARSSRRSARCPSGTGRYAKYQNGFIFQRYGGNAHEVHGSVSTKYSEQGSYRGELGYPTTNLTRVSDGSGYYNKFENGVIYVGPGGTHAVAGGFRDKLAAASAARSARSATRRRGRARPPVASGATSCSSRAACGSAGARACTG